MLTSYTVHAQKAGITGIINDTSATHPLHYAIIALLDKKDSVLVTSSRSFANGGFLLDKIKAGNYTVMITFPGMADFIVDINIKDTGIVNLGKIVMTSRFHLLQEVIVQSGKAIRMRGDTLEFKADSFQVAPGANVEELLRRLPGIEVGKDGKIKAQGENVTRVLVDGDEFFADDPTLATQYLQAKSIDKVQVFDKKSDQAIFSGIDDGIHNKTINLKLKENSKNGFFGKVSAGTDTKDFYSNEAMLNVFRGKEKVSAFAVGSNTGVTGLSGQDRSQYVGNTYNDGIPDETGNMIGNYIDNSDKYYGSGLPISLYGGTQYANKWNANKQALNFNYRLNELHTNGWRTGASSQLLPDSSIRQYKNNSTSSSYSLQHKAAGNIDLVLDSFSTVKINIGGQTQQNNSGELSYSESTDGFGKFLNKSTQQNQITGNSAAFSTSVLWRRNTRKTGRSFSLTLLQNYSAGESTRQTEALSLYYNAPTNSSGDSLNQQQLNKNKTSSIAARITYTEPLGKNIFLSAEYSWRTTNSDKDRNVMMRGTGGKYDSHIDSLSNNYTFNVISHMPGLTLNYNPKKFNISGGGRIGISTLEQFDRDLHTNTRRNFINLFPTAQASYNIAQSHSIRLNYSGRTSQPSIDQLQPLRDNSNPLSVTIGNPDLRPSFSHNMGISYQQYKMANSSNFNFSLNWSRSLNSIMSSQVIDQFNKTTTQYINRDGLPSINAFIFYSRRLGKQSNNSNINLGFSLSASKYGYLRLLNNIENRTDQVSLSAGPNISFYKYKFLNLNYSANISHSESHSTIGDIAGSSYLTHNHNVNVTAYFFWKMELNSDVNMNFQPANSAFNTSRQVIKWNASLLKKFLKNGQAQLKVAVYDILNQNTGYNRYTNGSSFGESSNNFIPRFALISLTWNFTRTL